MQHEWLGLSLSSRSIWAHLHSDCRVPWAARKGQAPMYKYFLVLCLSHGCYYSIGQNKSHGKAQSEWALRIRRKGHVDTRRWIICGHFCNLSYLLNMVSLTSRTEPWMDSYIALAIFTGKQSQKLPQCSVFNRSKIWIHALITNLTSTNIYWTLCEIYQHFIHVISFELKNTQ